MTQEQFIAIGQWWTIGEPDDGVCWVHYSDGFRSNHMHLPEGVAATLVSALKESENHLTKATPEHVDNTSTIVPFDV